MRSGLEKSKEILTKLRLPAAIYQEYRQRMDGFLAIFAAPLPKGASSGLHIRKFRTLKSFIFAREYLVAYANPTWFRRSFPGTDAIAAQELSIGGMPSPPLVIIPEPKRIASTIGARSVIEHEFVHVTQILRDDFPGDPQGTSQELLRWLFDATRAEYEANLIQLARWPQLYLQSEAPKHMSLENWCVFRGYTQSLERIVSVSIKGGFAKSEVGRVFRELPSVLPGRFRRLGFDIKLGEYCASRLDAFVETACRNLAAGDPDFKKRLLAIRRSLASRPRDGS